jgi:hypothetical protein
MPFSHCYQFYSHLTGSEPSYSSFPMLRRSSIGHVPHQLLVTPGHECLANTGLSGYTLKMISSKDRRSQTFSPTIFYFLASAKKAIK